MKAEELRIGNWLYNYKNTPVQILEWTGNEAYLTEGRKAYSIKRSNPILLTNEWLEKFGFKYTDWLGSWSDWEGKIGLVKTENGSFKLENYPCQDLKYVHQLQNLYYALTGKEL